MFKFVMITINRNVLIEIDRYGLIPSTNNIINILNNRQTCTCVLRRANRLQYLESQSTPPIVINPANVDTGLIVSSMAHTYVVTDRFLI